MTINAGVRYDVQLPFYSLNSLYSYATIDDLCGRSGKKSENSCNLFQPGVMPGTSPSFKQLNAGTKPYDTDYNNIAPSVGFAWTPERRSGFLGTLMGPRNDFVIRGGYTLAAARRPERLHGDSAPTPASASSRTATKRAPTRDHAAPLRDTARLTIPSFPNSPCIR